MNEAGNRFALRERTWGDHERLDALVGHFGDGKSYTRYLEGMAAFRAPIETALSRADLAPHFGDWRPVMISTELAQDLSDLGGNAMSSNEAFVLPSDRDGLLGVLYVLEGSSLGARVLVRRASALGFTAGHGARHLAAQVAQPQAWPQFVALLDTIGPAGMERAVEAARTTFATAINAFGGIDERERAC
jgi:heme oxygenase